MTRIESTLPNWVGTEYAGTRFDNHYVIYTRHRDSGTIDESNWRTIIKHLDKNNVTYENVRFSHWAVGWVEQLLIKDDDVKAIEVGEGVQKQLSKYPIFDEDDHSELENERVNWFVERIRDEINGLDDGEELSTWGNVKRNMTDWEIADVVRDEGWVEI
jgi:hypothetical protein